MYYWYWLAAGIGIVFLELLTPGFYFLWIGLAAIMSGIVNFIFPELSFIYLGVIFSVLAILLCYFGKVSLYKKIKSDSASTLNRRSSQYIGNKVLVVDDIVHGTGKVKVGDGLWTAKSEKDIKAGETVEIVEAEGTYFIVK